MKKSHLRISSYNISEGGGKARGDGCLLSAIKRCIQMTKKRRLCFCSKGGSKKKSPAGLDSDGCGIRLCRGSSRKALLIQTSPIDLLSRFIRLAPPACRTATPAMSRDVAAVELHDVRQVPRAFRQEEE